METETENEHAQSDSRGRSSSLKSLLAKKVRDVKQVGQRLSKLNKNQSVSDELTAKLLSFSFIEDDAPRLVRTNAIKIKQPDQRPRSNSFATSTIKHAESFLSVKSEDFKENRHLKDEYNEATILNDDGAEEFNAFLFWRPDFQEFNSLEEDCNGNVVSLNQEMGNKTSAGKKSGSNPRAELGAPEGIETCQQAQQHPEKDQEEEISSYKTVEHIHSFTCEDFRLKKECSSDSFPDLPLDGESEDKEEKPEIKHSIQQPSVKLFEFVEIEADLLRKQVVNLQYLNLESLVRKTTTREIFFSKIYLGNKSFSLTAIDMPDIMNQMNPNSGPPRSGNQPFTLTRHKKVEIPSSLQGPSVRREPADLGIPYPAVQEESNVLRKVASLTYDMASETKYQPQRRPEKHEFTVSDKFEGNVLVANLLSSIDEDHYLRLLISNNDLRLLMSHFVNYLLNIGIICPLEEASSDKFMMDRMYRWGYKGPKTESILVQEHLIALDRMRQENESERRRLDEMGRRMKEMEELIAGLRMELAKSREPPPYVPPPSPYESGKISRGTQTLHISAAPPPGAPPPPPPPPPPPLIAGCIPPPPPMAGSIPPPPPIAGSIPPPPPMAGFIPPPPPMAGSIPPPPPMTGSIPPPPPMTGSIPPPPPMTGSIPPPPPMGGPPIPPPMGGPPIPPPMGGPPPPPGGFSPPSLPPPPAGGWNSNKIVLRKNPIDPKAPMKPLYWTRILVPSQPTQQQLFQDSKDSESNLWETLEEVAPESWDEFTELFSRQVVASKPLKPKPDNKPAKQQAIKILDNKRSQAVGILVSSRHLDVQEVESAVYNLDTSLIDLETLQKIFELRATDEELTSMKMTIEQQPDAVLDKPETFLLELASIPHFTERVACFMFQNSFFENLATISNPLNNLKLTCDKLMTSVGVSHVLGIVLALGNYMNGGNRQRGQADGFAIDILPKLKDVKSKDNTLTLIYYIVKIFIQKFDDKAGTSDARMPLPEPTDLDKAGQLKFEELEGSMKMLNKEIECTEQKASLVIAASDEAHLEPFKGKMETFFVQAKKSLRDEEENLEECKQKFAAVLKYFKYTPKKNAELDPKEFFGLWSSFASDFKDVWNREQQRIFKENLDKAKQMVKEKKLQVSKSYSKKSTEEGSLKAKLLSRKKK